MGFHCEAKDAAALLRKCLIRRGLFTEKALKPVIRTDNGPKYEFQSYAEAYEVVNESMNIPMDIDLTSLR